MLVKRTVTITAEDITRGERNDCEHCPGALAIARAFPELLRVEVENSGLNYCTGQDELWKSRDRPWLLRRFVYQFDDGQHVDPIEFELELDL